MCPDLNINAWLAFGLSLVNKRGLDKSPSGGYQKKNLWDIVYMEPFAASEGSKAC
jgi:hypothetical protein